MQVRKEIGKKITCIKKSDSENVPPQYEALRVDLYLSNDL